MPTTFGNKTSIKYLIIMVLIKRSSTAHPPLEPSEYSNKRLLSRKRNEDRQKGYDCERRNES